MTDLCTFEQIRPDDVGSVGGKGLSLGLLASAGLPVPPGFCLTTLAHRRLRGRSLQEDPALVEAIRAAYRTLGEGSVAVRSSATAEDGAVASFAGQQETILGVSGDEAVRSAIERCWASLDSERAISYRRHQQISDEGLAMAVVVQRLVPAEVSGVLFTSDPLDAQGRRMLVEASWGLGEGIVSGRVMPDRYHLDRSTGAVSDRHIATKTLQATTTGLEAVPIDKQTIACLSDAQLAELGELGRRVEQFYGATRDIEWAWAEGRFWLLQARPITTASAAEREGVRREEIEGLTKLADPAGTVWGRFNLSEVLPEPTPMSWHIARRFMSGQGGYGLMFRDLGFDPDPVLDQQGVFDLVCGRPYCNLSREARMHYQKIPFEYPFAALKADPRQAFYPSPGINHARLPWHFWLLLPIQVTRLILQLSKGAAVRVEATRTFAERYRKEIGPAFRQEVEKGLAEDLTQLKPEALLARLEHWTSRTLVDFARDSLKPSALAQEGLKKIEMFLTPLLGPERSRAAARELIMGVHPDPESDLGGAVRELSAGRINEAGFLEKFGHRCGQEMELSLPRWAEAPERLKRSIQTGVMTPAREGLAPWERIADEAKLAGSRRETFRLEVEALGGYVGLRETAKNDLMRGYALIRKVLLALDARYRLQGGVFFLTPEELPELVAGKDLTERIAQRRRRRSVALSLEVPPVLFSDDPEAIGRPVVLEGVDVLRGTPLSAGVVEALALVLEEPLEGDPPLDKYILVCPSTDPAWVPLFVHARGLVMETGGVLSHGAIVAREFGLPAVAGIPGVQKLLRTGQRLRVDGAQGTVSVVPE